MSDTKPFIARTTRLTVLPEGEPLYSERATNISIEDEAGGEFIVIGQTGGKNDTDSHEIRIDPEEWLLIEKSVKKLLAEIERNCKK